MLIDAVDKCTIEVEEKAVSMRLIGSDPLPDLLIRCFMWNKTRSQNELSELARSCQSFIEQIKLCKEAAG
jgi:hypothetical protein